MQRRKFLRTVGAPLVWSATAGVVAGTSACSSQLPDAAVAAWRGPAPHEEIRRWALSHALLAPHSHNLQSWQADLREPGVITLRCDLQRLLPQTDPQSRQIMMSHGTFLELLDMAARERAHRAEIELFPQGAFGADRIDTRAVARVRLVPDASVARDPLFAQVFARRTNREPYALEPVPTAAAQAIAKELSAPGLRGGLVQLDQAAEMAAHRALANEAWRIEMLTPHAMMESMRWIRVGPQEIERHRDGISLNDPMVRLASSLGLFDRSRMPEPDSSVVKEQMADFEGLMAATPAFLWLISESADRASQVGAGRAFVRAHLAATAQGLTLQPLSQALQEYPEQAGPYQRIRRLVQAGEGEVVQMWVRVGRGPAVQPAPRRGLQALLA